MPTRTQTKSSQKIEKLKELELNKNLLIAKTLEAFKPKAKFLPFKNTYFKNFSKISLFSYSAKSDFEH